MLSAGKPPPDPPSACDELVPPLNSDERASSPSPPQLPDLTDNPPRSDFSIRDYVFAARSKDISKSWPFSLRSLQLLPKDGVNDLLPPFQSLDDVRHRPFAKSSAKTSCSLEEIDPSISAEEPLRLNNEDNNARSNDGLAGNNFPSTTTTASPIETESVPTIRKPRSHSVPARPDLLRVTSVEKVPAGPTVVRKTRSAVRSACKKDRLVVKLGGDLERSSADDIASNGTAVSESMASKVCPVCKTFSSSSNTTLNAHIDQCLSEEPTPKWSAGSKLSRHRVKPRKNRLMMEIYDTAPRCTLEDLDRRNGSNWATGIKLPFLDPDPEEERMERVPPVNPDQDAGGVYVDSNGRKLRSLSSFSKSQPSSSRAGEPLGPRKCVKGKMDKVLRPRKTKMMKKNAQKHHNNRELVSKSKHFSSHKDSEDSSDEDEDSRGSRGATDDARLPVSRSQSPLLAGDNGTLKPWACSRRSALPKKITGNECHPPRRCSLHSAQDLLVERGRSYFANKPISDEYGSGSPEQPRSSGGMGVEVTEGESPGKRKLGSPFSSGPDDRNLEESNFGPVKRRESRSSDAVEATGGCTFHGSNKTSNSPSACEKSSKNSGISPSKVMRFSRVRKRKRPPTRSIRRPDLDDTKRVSTPEPSEMHLMGDMSKEDNNDGNPSPAAVTGGFGQDAGRTSASEELQFGGNGDGKGAETSVSLSTDKSEKLDVQGQGHEDEGGDTLRASELHSKSGTEDNPSDFSKYLSQGAPIENRIVPARSTTETYKDGSCDTESPTTVPGIITKDVGDGTNQQGPDVDLNVDAQDRQEYEVEPILIPGPPGSFLPSPGAVGSEEFQGNSSLTTSRVQSSQEQQQDLATGGSSGSPISATSTVSNSAPAGSEKKPLGPQVVEEKAVSGSSSGVAMEPLGSNAASNPQASTMGVSSERMSIEKGPLILKNDDQPCCCQRRKETVQYIPCVATDEERNSHGFVPDYPESQLLRRRNLGTLTAIGLGKLPNQSPNITPGPVEARHEVLPRGAVQEVKSETARSSSEARHEVLPRGAVQEVKSETTRSSSVPVTLMGSTFLGTKVSDRGEVDAAAPVAPATPATPSVSNPVLRLMGKDLMVVNNEEGASTPLGFSKPAPGAWSNNPSSSQVSRMSGVSSSSAPVSFTDYRPAIGEQFQTVMEPPAAPPRQFKTVMEPLAAPPGMPINRQESGYNNGTFYYPNQPPRSDVAAPGSRDPRPMKEIIIIDDGPEYEISYIPANYVGRRGGSRERKPLVAPPPDWFPPKPAQSYDPRLAGTFPFASPSSSQDPSFFGQVPISRRAGPSSMGVHWCSPPPEGPGAFQQGHLAPAQSSPNIPIPSHSYLTPREYSRGHP